MWNQPNDAEKADGNKFLSGLNQRYAGFKNDQTSTTNFQIDSENTIDFKGRQAQRLDFSFTRGGDSADMEGLALSFYESETGRIFHINMGYKKSLAPLSQQFLDSFEISV